MTLSIGDLARATGTTVETIRYYERVGVLPAPARTGGGQRAYTPVHLNRLGFVRRARDLGFTLDQVRALLDLADQPDRDCAAVDEVARARLAEVDRKLADLAALRRELASLVETCGHGRVAECRIVEALSPDQSDAPSPLLGSMECTRPSARAGPSLRAQSAEPRTAAPAERRSPR
jgi:Cu(I)-responsive transcriptional regulator